MKNIFPTFEEIYQGYVDADGNHLIYGGKHGE